MTLGGNVCIRNGNDLDFCWRESIKSLLPVCDTVTVCDADSTDGTQEELRAWCEREPKLRLCVYSWPNPQGDNDFWVKWLNYCRDHVRTDWHLQLDADEVLHEKSYDEIRQFIATPHWPKAGFVTRYNFWKDHRHTIPEGVALGKRVIRIAPQNVWLPSDGAHPMGKTVCEMAQGTGIEIFHYGFLRKREAFFKKEKLLQGYFFGGPFDWRVTGVEKKDGNWMAEIEGIEWKDRLDEFNGTHPQVAQQWLKDRNYE